MAWLPRPAALGLLLCLVGEAVTEGAGGAVRADEPRAADGTPLPRARPDPDAPVAPAPVAVAPANAPTAAPVVPPVAPATPAAGVETPPPPANPPLGIAQLIDAPAAPLAATPAAQAATPAPAPPASTATVAAGDTSVALLLLAAALAAGAFILVRWGLAALGSRPGARWPTTIATVVYSEVASETRRDRAGRPSVRYVPVIAYDYEVDGVAHRAARLRFADAARSSESEAKAITERFPVGAGIEIRHHPARPGEAVIESAPDRIGASLIAGIALAVLALAALISALV